MIAFRVDANEHIATGHLMRCMVIALRLREMGQECIFYMAEEKHTRRLEKYNLPYKILNTCWNDMEAELPVLTEELKQDMPEWIVVDSYQVTQKYLRDLEAITKVFYLDDMKKEKYPVSAVLYYSNWLEDDSYEAAYADTNTSVLTGMQYTPLREEFYPEERERSKRILITTGGTDTYNVAGIFLERIAEFPEVKEYDFCVIVGQMNQNKEKLEVLEKSNAQITLHYDVDNMGEMMRSCDYAVSAGGTTLYELCACQIPTVCFSFAENQEECVRKMEEKQIMLCAGDARYGVDVTVRNIGQGLIQFIKNPEMAKSMKERMSHLIDGKGAVRVAEFLGNR